MIFKKHWPFILFAAGFALIVGYKLLAFPRPIYDWDESLYIQNGLEMLRDRQFLVPRWQGQPWLDKPPLAPLLLGLVASLPNIPAEISTRLYTLFLSVTALILVYALYLRAGKSRLAATLTTAVTAFFPIFVQRSQVVSLDVTLLIGWLGYFLFLDRPAINTVFLFLSVQSKSLLGFYPLAVYALYLGYRFVRREIKATELVKKGRVMLIQTGLLLAWYLLAWLVYREQFWQLHIIESHFRRVSASLESHFGQRTFYLDLLIAELNWLSALSLVGFLASLYLYLKNKIDTTTFFLQNAFFPWFVFLNLTKTKIAWYLYPVLPQFAFYASLLLGFLHKNKRLQSLAFLAVLAAVLYRGVVKNGLLTTFYSDNDAHIKISKLANSRCRSLAVLVPDYTRDTYRTLKGMNLTITTTSWWGEHPSMVFYFGKPLRFFYDRNNFLNSLNRYDCAVFNREEQIAADKRNLKMIKAFDKMLLYQNRYD